MKILINYFEINFNGIQESNKIKKVKLRKVHELGCGGLGKVFKVTKDQKFALKEMNIVDANVSKFMNFINVYETLLKLMVSF